jgi:hypothetical protein
MECYQFLQDEDELKRFRERILPKLGKDEVFYLMLGARHKYLTDEEKGIYNMNGSDMIRRVTVRSNSFETLRDSILDFCVPEGRYKDKNGKPLPIHCFTLYITPNPRDSRRASVSIVQKITEALLNHNTTMRLENMMLSEIHKYSTNKVWIDLDLDPKGNDDPIKTLETIYTILGDTETITVKTRSGFHVLVKKDSLDNRIKKSFFKDIKTLSDTMEGEVEFKGDTLLPVPGCLQGGKVPYIWHI